ncbi:MAG: hypothetical protein ACFWUJ_20385 [Pseudomonas fragi]
MADLLRMLTCSVYPLPLPRQPCRLFCGHSPCTRCRAARQWSPTADRGRYDLLSAWPEAELTLQPDESGRDFLQRLRNSLQQLGNAALPDAYELPFAGGLIGYLSYDFGRQLEQLPAHALDDLHLPDARLGLYAWALITDHQAATANWCLHQALNRRNAIA